MANLESISLHINVESALPKKKFMSQLGISGAGLTQRLLKDVALDATLVYLGTKGQTLRGVIGLQNINSTFVRFRSRSKRLNPSKSHGSR